MNEMVRNPSRDGEDCDTEGFCFLSYYMKILKLYRSLVDQRLKDRGVHQSYQQLLIILSQHPNISQKEMARMLHISTPAITAAAKKLEREGYIRRLVSEEDNRVNRISLTEEGKTLAQTIRQSCREIERGMMEGFSENDKKEMAGHLNRIYSNLSRLPPEDRKEGVDKK